MLDTLSILVDSIVHWNPSVLVVYPQVKVFFLNFVKNLSPAGGVPTGKKSLKIFLKIIFPARLSNAAHAVEGGWLQHPHGWEMAPRILCVGVHADKVELPNYMISFILIWML